MDKQAVTKSKLSKLLSELEASTEDCLTLYLKPSSFAYYMNELSLDAKHITWLDEIKDLANTKGVIQEAARYRTGAAIFWQASGYKYIVLPPFPISETKFSFGKPDIAPLREILEKKYAIGVILVAWGSYSIGIFHGDNLVQSKTGTGYIHKEHKKGGSSQKRFARRTQEAKRDFLRKVAHRIEEKLEDQTLDYIFFGGNRLILKPLSKECTYLESEANKICGRILDVRHADREALEHTLREINTSVAFSE
jgi:peptide subunit release factor 1 (eRF1)